jgi:hypothetical protein
MWTYPSSPEPSSSGEGDWLFAEHLPSDEDRVDLASLGSFPASDAPPWPSGEDPDGGQVFERERRRRHID